MKKIELRKKNIMQHPQEEIKLQEHVLRNLLFTMDWSQGWRSQQTGLDEKSFDSQ